MALTGKDRELECNTPEARLDRIEKTLIALGKEMDRCSHFSVPIYDWEYKISKTLEVKGKQKKQMTRVVHCKKEKTITVGGIEVPVGTTVGEWLKIANKEAYDILSKGRK